MPFIDGPQADDKPEGSLLVLNRMRNDRGIKKGGRLQRVLLGEERPYKLLILLRHLQVAGNAVLHVFEVLSENIFRHLQRHLDTIVNIIEDAVSLFLRLGEDAEQYVLHL